MEMLKKGFLAANLLIYGGFVVTAYLMPGWLTQQLGIQLLDGTAHADFQAMYGGLCLASSFVFVLGLVRKEHEATALWLATAGAGGLALGRIISLVSHGPAGMFVYGSLASELGGVAFGAWLLSRVRPAMVPALGR